MGINFESDAVVSQCEKCLLSINGKIKKIYNETIQNVYSVVS